MRDNRTQARDYIDGLSKTSFWEIVNEAKISDRDKKLLDARFVRGLSYQEIEEELHLTQGTIRNKIQKTYDKISKLILGQGE